MKIVAFDIDGVILDSMAEFITGTSKTLEKFGLPQISVKEYQKFSAATLEKWMECVASHVEIEDIHAFTLEYLEQRKNIKPKVFAEIIETIKKIKNSGYKICIISNRPIFSYNEEIAPVLEDIGFDYIRCRDLDLNELGGRSKLCKPNPEYLDRVLGHFNAKPSDITYIGDLYEDYEFANKTGMNFIWAAYGQDNGRLASVSGLCKVEKPNEIPNIIMEFAKC